MFDDTYLQRVDRGDEGGDHLLFAADDARQEDAVFLRIAGERVLYNGVGFLTDKEQLGAFFNNIGHINDVKIVNNPAIIIPRYYNIFVYVLK